jgi:hypothetical protein
VEGLVTRSAAVGEAASSRARARALYGPALTLAVGLCAALPVIAASVRALNEGWQPVADRGIIATRSFDVLSSHMPLVGQYSFAGSVTGKLTYSLGPMLYWLLAPAAHVGAPGSFVLTMALVNVACVLGAVALARRRGGVWLMVAAAVGIGLMCRSIAANNFYDIWNPSAGLFPLLALIFVCWSLACGDYRLLPLTVLVVSFVVQCQLAFVPPCLGLLAVGLVGLVVSRRSSASASRASAPSSRRGVWPWAVAALVVAVVCWTPPLIDQFQGKPGNLTNVVKAANAHTPKLGAAVGWHAVVRAVGVPPWWLRNPASPWNRKFEVRETTSTLATVSTILILVALSAVAAIGALRRRAELWSGALIALLLCAGLYAVAAATPTKRVLAETLGYTMWWGSPAGMFVWVMLAFSAVVVVAELALPRVRIRALASAGAGAAIVATGAAAAIVAGAAAAVAVGERSDYHLPEYGPLAKLYAGLERGVPPHRTVKLLGYLGNRTFRFKMAARYAMVRRGIRPLSPGIDVRLGSWYDLDHRRYDCTVYVKDGITSPAQLASEAARFNFEDATGSYPVTVWVSPAGCSRGAASRQARR